MDRKERLVQKLYQIGVIQFGTFTLKSGRTSDHYFDLRKLIAYPELMSEVAEMITELAFKTEQVCGLAYSGIPLGTCVSLQMNTPQLLVRKERKEYGTKKLVEGVYQKGQKVLLVDDVITSGASLVETIAALEAEGLVIEQIVVLIDRQEVKNPVLEKYNISSILQSDFIFRTIKESRMGKRLYDTMLRKRSNLALSADLDTGAAILDLVSKVGSEICLLKLHLDSFEYDTDFLREINKLGQELDFLILEDRKLADIGKIVQKQVQKFEDHVDLVTVHGIFGQGTLDGLEGSKVSSLLLAQSSSQDNLIDAQYTANVLKLGQENWGQVAGFISQQNLGDNTFLYLTPGVHLDKTGDSMKQQYRTPEDAILKDGCDIIIVGRGICSNANPVKAAKEYRERAFAAYELKQN